MRLSGAQMKWLKCFHLLSVAGWVGGALSVIVLYFLRFKGAEMGSHLHGIDMASNQIDLWVIIALGGVGCLVTGLVYSIFTNWGFFRHRWVCVKWIVVAFCLLSGTFWLGPLETNMLNISSQFGANAPMDEKYISGIYLNFWLGIMQIALLIFAMFISVLKPWKRR
jgi:uncharacterized membrane protein